MRPSRIALRVVLLAAGTLSFAAAAATYKWVDEKGVVNYGNALPAAARQVKQLDDEAARVSTIQAVPKTQLDREKDFLLRARIARLEAEIEEQRLARAAMPVRMPVYDPYYAYPPLVAGYAPAYGVPYYGSRTRFGHRPMHAPVRSGASVRVGGRR
jgi:hypothetical protein